MSTRAVTTLSLVAALTFPAAAGATAPDPGWKARWITTPGGARAPNSWLAFRRSFDLARAPRVAVARIAVDSKLWLWVNGTLVVREGGLSRGPTPTGTYFDRVELTPHLRKGHNVIAALTWYWGRSGRYHQSSGQAGLLFQLDADGDTVLASDPAWRVRTHPAFRDVPAPGPASFVPVPDVRFDAREDQPMQGAAANWTSDGFDDAAWAKAEDRGAPPVAPWNALVARPTPQWRDHGLVPYAALTLEPQSGGGLIARGRLPYNAQVTPWLEVEAPAGLVIDIRTDHHDVSGGPGDSHRYLNVRAEYVTRDGRQGFEALSWMSGEEVLYTLPAGVKPLRFAYRETGYDTDFTGHFAASDPLLVRLWAKAQRTLYVNVRDVFMDCPDRERGQWIGDVAVEVPQTFYAFDRRIDALTRKAVDEIVNWARDGRLFSVVPGGRPNELPSQALHVISKLGPAWTLYEHTGDASRLASSFVAARAYVDLWKLGPDGLVEPRKKVWAWFDHGADIDVPVNENAWYYGALVALADAAPIVGRAGEAPALRQRAHALAAAFDRLLWRGDAYQSRAGESADDRGNAVAVVVGLAPPARWPALREVLTQVKHATPYMEKTVLEALYRMGAPGAALERMRTRYRAMIDDGSSTLWEDFSKHGTTNHAWSGGPLYLLSRYVAGVEPRSPGYRSIAILPRPADLTFVEVTVPSAAGLIRARVDRDDARVRLRAELPSGTRALIGLPLPETRPRRLPDVLLVGGRPAGSGARPQHLPAGLRTAGADDTHLLFEATAGVWELEGRFHPRP